MANIEINLGDAFLIRTSPNGKHLYIAIAPTYEHKYLFVNVTARRSTSEATCILFPGSDVPDFIVHESVIAYQYAREMDAGELARLIAPNSPIPYGACSNIILTQIQQGGLVSPRLKNRYKTALKFFLGIQ